jgi:hypothetical membrane protein
MNDTPSRQNSLSAAPAILLLLGSVAFTVAWVSLGFISDGYSFFDIVIEDYSPISQPISGLGLGNTGLAMNSAFVLYGLIAVAGAIGISRGLGRVDSRAGRTALVTFGLHGLGAALVGIFTLEQMEMHSFGFLLVLAPIIGFTMIGRRLTPHPEWRTLGQLLTRIATPVGLLLVVVFFATFDPEAAGAGEGFAGLSQRALVIHLQAWIVTIAWTTMRRTADGLNESSAK